MHGNSFFSVFKNSTISDLFDEAPIFFADLGVLITCLDSSPAPADASPWINKLKSCGIQPVTIEKAVWVESAQVKNLMEGGLLSGFDEIYLLGRRPSEAITLDSIHTADRIQFGNHPPEPVVDNMRRLGARRYASDGTGIGLNIVYEDKSLRKWIDCLGK